MNSNEITNKIANAILNGIYQAFDVQWKRAGKSVDDMYPNSGYRWWDERVLQCEIADAVYKAGYKHMNYEYPVRLLMGKKGKIDLLIRDNKQRPLAIVEIKAEYGDIRKDVARICELLNCRKDMNPDLFGVFAVGLVRYKEEQINAEFNGGEESLEIKVLKPVTEEKGCKYDTPIIYGKIVNKGKCFWGGGCFVISPNSD